jgi:HPt (histidine-containing phosphotransfer) domain-containing protein
MRTYYGRLEMSSTRNDLMVNLHALRGAASGVGAFALAQLARTAEDELRAGAPVNPERIDDIGLAVEEVRAFIGPLIADEPTE